MKKIFLAAIAVSIIFTLTSCGGSMPENEVNSAADMQGRTVGVITGSAAEWYLEPFASAFDVRGYGSAGELAEALKSGSVDCAVADEDTYNSMKKAVSKLSALDEPFIDRTYCMAVSADNTQLLNKLVKALEDLENSGTLESMVSGWRDGTYGYGSTEDPGLPRVTVAVDPTFRPYAFYDENGELAGLEIDLIRAVCSELGLSAELTPVASDKLLYMAESGKVSFAVGRIVLDDENTAILFTQPYVRSTQLLIVREG
ncbi:MAG: transporter substrate-binding domain-containing protein [Oscillospiraceae bacterium]